MSRLVLLARISCWCQVVAALSLLGVVLATRWPLPRITDLVLLVAFVGNTALLASLVPRIPRREPPPPEVVTIDHWPAHP